MTQAHTNLKIETLVLVAIWERPFIFQGRFNVHTLEGDLIQTLYFRIECTLKDKRSISEKKFSPRHYHFTHLLNEQCKIDLNTPNHGLELALYILKHSLKLTLEKMIRKPTQCLAYADEIAMSSITKQIEYYVINRENKDLDDHIGFAVSVDFKPSETMSQAAALFLLTIDQFSEHH